MLPTNSTDADELVRNPHRMTLWGTPATSHFPPLCPHCGKAALSSIKYAKSFVRTRAHSSVKFTGNFVVWVAVPFCDDCIARHRAELPKRSLARIVLSTFASAQIVGLVLPGILGLAAAFKALGALLQGQWDAFGLFALVSLFFGLIAWYQGRTAWATTAYLRVPPLTSTTQAFDFSDYAPKPFESAKFTCTMRDERFAAAFATLNRQSEFVPGSARAAADLRAASRQRWAVGTVIVVLGLLLWLWHVFK